MPKHKHTNQFSIIGLLDGPAAADIRKLRQTLPPSPYRDDPPHLTLVYDVRAPENINDSELKLKLQPIISEALNIPVHARVKKIVNRRGSLYGTTSLILLQLTPEFRYLRKKLIKSLHAHGFKTNRLLDILYLPHVSIRLGVPIMDELRQKAMAMFPPGRGVNIATLEIYRLISIRGRRLFYPIRLRKLHSRTLS